MPLRYATVSLALQMATILYFTVLSILTPKKMRDAQLFIARMTTAWVVIAAVVVVVLVVAV